MNNITIPKKLLDEIEAALLTAQLQVSPATSEWKEIRKAYEKVRVVKLLNVMPEAL